MKLKLKKIVLRTGQLLRRKRLKKLAFKVLMVALRVLLRKILEGALDSVFPPGATRSPGRAARPIAA